MEEDKVNNVIPKEVFELHREIRDYCKAINAPDTLHAKGIAIGRRMLSEGAHYGDALHHAAYYIDVNWSGHKRPNTVIISTKLS